MGSSLNQGNQILTWDYLNEASSLSFNKVLKDLLRIGLYRGGLLFCNGSTISVSPYTMLIETSNPEFERQLAVRVETKDSFNLAYNAATPFVVAEMEWLEVEDNFALVKCVNEVYLANNPLAIVFGKIESNFSVNYTIRDFVSNKADTIPLGDTVAIDNNPVGGVRSQFSGESFISQILVDLYSRLNNLSGASNKSVSSRLLNLGIDEGEVNATILPIKESLTLGGGLPSLPPTSSVTASLAAISAALKSLTGVDDGSVLVRHLSLGEGSTKLSSKTLPLGENLNQSIAGQSPIALTKTDVASLALSVIAARLSSIATRLENDIQALASLTADHASLAQQVGGMPLLSNLPVGLIWEFDGVGWVDNVTIPGWYACISANSNKNCPNLVNKFTRGAAVVGYPSLINMSNRFGGADSVALSEANLPSHRHSMNHGHTATAASDGAHSHTLRIYSESGTTPYRGQGTQGSNGSGYWDNAGTCLSAGSHSHTISIAALAADTGSVGSGATFSTVPAFYSTIYIRKCN
jgi:hypothetical protein